MDLNTLVMLLVIGFASGYIVKALQTKEGYVYNVGPFKIPNTYEIHKDGTILEANFFSFLKILIFAFKVEKKGVGYFLHPGPLYDYFTCTFCMSFWAALILIPFFLPLTLPLYVLYIFGVATVSSLVASQF